MLIHVYVDVTCGSDVELVQQLLLDAVYELKQDL